jgi:hypothetical protein
MHPCIHASMHPCIHASLCVYFSAGHWKYEIEVTSVKKLPVFAAFFRAVDGQFRTYAGNPWD